MTTEILSDLENKGFYKIAHKIKKSTAIDQFNLELHWTDYLQDLVDYGNKNLLKAFQYRLVMDEV
jgi:hypothetical protein